MEKTPQEILNEIKQMLASMNISAGAITLEEAEKKIDILSNTLNQNNIKI